MTRKSRYKQLCHAYDQGVEECDNYRKECREFVNELRSYVIEGMGCPEPKVFMFPPSAGFDYKGQTLQGDALDTEFGENGTAGIGFAINVNNIDPEDKFFTFIVIFKKTGGKFRFSVDEEKEFTNTPEDFSDFCDYLFEVARKNLAGRLENFLQSPYNENKPIGFKLSSVD